jgi:phenylpyruvate tautomerase PptA (4-oxalocrotonate tautomerase family)
MPIIVVENRANLTPRTNAQLASGITDVVQDVIESPLDLISVVFHDLAPEDSYRSGARSEETLIFCHIRAGRSDHAIQTLLERVSETWSRVTGDSEAAIELAVAQYPAKHTMRGGVRLPEPAAV